MSLTMLFKDELIGFYRSKVMIMLLVGLPALTLLMYYLAPDLGDMPMARFTAILVSAVAALLASTMLSVTIINERSRGVYDLFVIRPIRRTDLVMAKFLAVVVCVLSASILAILLGQAYDWYSGAAMDWAALGDPLMITVAMTCISCAAAVLIGSVFRSVLIGVIVTVYGGNELAAIVVMPALTESFTVEATLALSLAVTAVVLAIGAYVFKGRVSC